MKNLIFLIALIIFAQFTILPMTTSALGTKGFLTTKTTKCNPGGTMCTSFSGDCCKGCLVFGMGLAGICKK